MTKGEVMVNTDAFGVVTIGYVETLGSPIVATVETKHGDFINLDAIMCLGYDPDTRKLEWQLGDEFFQRLLDRELVKQQTERNEIIDITNLLTRRF